LEGKEEITKKIAMSEEEKLRAPSELKNLLQEVDAKMKKNIASSITPAKKKPDMVVLQPPTLKKEKKIPVKLDEIDQMMLDFKVATPDELRKRHEQLATT
jgi:hypothetical protein